MKLKGVTKLDKRNKTLLKKFEDEIVSENCDLTTLFSVYGQFSLIVTFYRKKKTELGTKKSLTQL